MVKFQFILNFCKKTRFLLVLILAIFFLKGLFLTAIFPIFQGPDEQTHYSTIQYYAEPKVKNWPIIESELKPNGNNIATYHFSEEIIETAKIAKFDEIKFKNTNTPFFTLGNIGDNENKILTNNWKRYIDIYPARTAATNPLYYFLAAQIEKIFSNESILVRFFLIRIFSVILGTLTVFLAYLISRKIGFSEKNSLLLMAIISFQPMFSFMSAIVNLDILLFFLFTLFAYGVVSVLKDGFQWKFAAILFFAAIAGALTKGPGMILIAFIFPILGYVIYKKLNPDLKKFIFYSFLISIILLGIFFLLGPQKITKIFTNFPVSSKFSTPIKSLQKYASVTNDRWSFSELSYWGAFGWLDTRISTKTLQYIWAIEIIALVGLLYGLIFKKGPPDFLPERKYIFFFILILLALQVVIRFYDWKVFYTAGRIEIGTPGRYFLPNIVPHFLVLFYGLGVLCRKKIYFDMFLLFSLVISAAFFLYSLINIIIPRYYL